MLKNKTTRIIIGIVIVLGVLAASSIWVSHAFKENSVDDFSYSSLDGNANASTTAVTQIDHIIDNSNKPDSDERDSYDTSNYYIYVIVPKEGMQYDVQQLFLKADYFQKKVIDDNRNIEATMADGKIQIVVKTVAELNTSSNPANDLADADLIYLYKDESTKDAYTKGSGSEIGEDLYAALHNYAFGSKKPLMITCEDLKNDGSQNDDGGSVTGSDTRMYNMTSVDFRNSWRRYKTINISTWDSTNVGNDDFKTIQDYLMDRDKSIYPSYELNNLTLPNGYDSWEAYWKRTDSDEKTLNILYITADYSRSDTLAATRLANWMVNTNSDPAVGGSNIIFGSEEDSPIDNRPTKAGIELKSPDELTPDSFYVTNSAGNKVNNYDFIFIAPDDYKNNDIRVEVRAELNKLSATYALNHECVTNILFGTQKSSVTVTPGTSTGYQKEDLTFDTTSNFGKLLDLSITTSGYAKKNNILVIGTKYMATLSNMPDSNTKKISKIVSLINKSRYRNHAGSGDSGDSGSVSTTAYRVLELQPCYPIDKVLASQSTITTETSQYVNVNSSGTGSAKPLGNYYTVPGNVLNTSELDNYRTYTTNADGSVTVNDMTEEYYQWDLSKAKVAYALGKSVDQIDLVQMSTDEFITAKADVSDSYDLIYIGGNMSALKHHLAYFGGQYYINPDWMEHLTVFSMYSHSGELEKGHNAFAGNSDYTRVGGNDITYDRLVSLEQYIDAGMPIVFSNEIWDAYTKAKQEKYKNKYMDPDSNMYKLCEYAEAHGGSSVLEGWQNKKAYAGSTDVFYTDYTVASEEQVIENKSGIYGDADYVTVYSDALKDSLQACVYGAGTSMRPRYTLDTNAVPYEEKNLKTRLDERTLTFTITLLDKIEGHTYQAVLLEDADDNGVFDMNSSEKLQTVALDASQESSTFTYEYKGEAGAFSWKIVIQDTTNGSKAPSRSYSAITCFNNTSGEKKTATILEIMPLSVKDFQEDNPSSPDGHTFYLDRNYQQASGNPYLYSSQDANGMNASWAGKYGYNGTLHNPGTANEDFLNSNDIMSSRANGYSQGSYMGKYKTQLSINRYDTELDREDRFYNYMDEVSDQFDFTLDIMYMEDILYYSQKAHDSSVDHDMYAEKAAEAYELYESYTKHVDGKDNYERLNQVETAMVDQLKNLRDGGSFTITNWNTQAQVTYSGSDYSLAGIDDIINSKDYFKFMLLNSEINPGSSNNDIKPSYAFYKTYYEPYIKVYDELVDAYRAYRHYSMLAYGPEKYLNENYDVIVVGFADDYTGRLKDFSAQASEDLTKFADNGGALLMTHDNITSNKNTGHLATMTSYMKSYMGMSQADQLKAVAGTGTTGMVKYSSTDPNRYFLTNLSADENLGMNDKLQGIVSNADWDKTVSAWGQKANLINSWTKASIVSDGFTDMYNISYTSQCMANKFTYAESNFESQRTYAMAISGPIPVTATSKAVQVNRGVVTTYPFYIASDLRVSNTHAQTYQLNLEDEDVVVWYTLAGDNMSKPGVVDSDSHDYSLLKKNSSLYAASPKDGADNYYIYSVGNITYCGAGNALITGPKRDNNDERRLFLNVLINMASKSQRTPEVSNEIIIYEPDGKTKAPGETIKCDKDTGEYSIKVKSSDAYPEFALGLKKGNSYTVTDVDVFYCLDYDNCNTADATKNIQVMANKEDIIQTLNSGGVYKINKANCEGLGLKAEYFEPYGDYTYVKIRVTLKNSEGAISTVDTYIKIILTKELLDLT